MNDKNFIEDSIDFINTDKASMKYSAYYHKYKREIWGKAITMYQWSGLPEHIDERFIEMVLMEDGKGVFYFIEVNGERVLVFSRVIEQGQQDRYENSTRLRGYSVNGVNVDLTQENSVVCYNNFLRVGVQADIEIYARELAQIKMTQCVNREHQKMPVMFYTDESGLLSTNNLIQKIKGFAHYVIGGKKLVKPEVLKTEAPYVVDKLEEDFKEQKANYLTFFGIEVGQEKKERMINSEITANMGEIEAQRYYFLRARRQCARELSKLLGTEITVDFISNTTELNTEENYQPQKNTINDEEEGGSE